MATAANSPFSPPQFTSNKRGLYRKNGFSQSPTAQFGRGKYRGGYNNYNQQIHSDRTFSDGLNLDELEAVLLLNFSQENFAIDNVAREINNTWFKTKKSVDAIVDISDQFNESALEEIANFEKSSAYQPSIKNGSKELESNEDLSVSQSAYKLNEIKHSKELAALRKEYDLLIEEMSLNVEVAIETNLSTGLENRQLKAALKSLATKHEKFKANFDAELEKDKAEMEKKLDVRLNSVNLLLKAEQKKYQKAEENMKKNVQDQVKAATTQQKVKLEALELEKEELARVLEVQVEENASLSTALTKTEEESKWKEEQLMARIKEIIKRNCECSICLCIFDKVMTTTCGHSFCKICIDDWIKSSGAQNKCPYCRQPCTYRNILFFDELIEELKQNFPSVEWTRNETSSSS